MLRRTLPCRDNVMEQLERVILLATSTDITDASVKAMQALPVSCIRLQGARGKSVCWCTNTCAVNGHGRRFDYLG